VNLFKRWTSGAKSKAKKDPAGYVIEVKCDRCGEIVRTRINLYNDLSLVYADEEGASGQAGYICNKSLMGSGQCFQRIQVELRFNENRKLVEKQIQGGRFLEEQV
jgi:hypothetical protein